ncbi:ABC transporter ATP-binding protein [Nitrospirota bacterium]
MRKIIARLPQRYNRRFAFSLVLMAVAAALVSLPPVLLAKVLDTFISHENIEIVIVVPFLIAIAASILVKEGLTVWRKYLIEDSATRIEKSLRTVLVDHVIHLDYSFFYKQQTGSLNGRLNRSIEGFSKLIKLAYLEFLPAVFVAGFALATAFVSAPAVGLLMALVVPVGALIVVLQVKSQKGIRIILLRSKEQIDGSVVELLGGVDNVRALHTENTEVKRVEDISERLRAQEIKHHISMSIYDALKYLNEGGFYIVLLCVTIWMAAEGMISVGDILKYSMLFMGVQAPLRELHRILDEGHECSIRVEDLINLLNEPVDVSYQNYDAKAIDANTDRSLPDSANIGLKGLSYVYPEQFVPALNNVKLTIREGEYLGVCGAAGSGKSTLLGVLLRLLHVEDSMVMLHGKPLASYGRKELSSLIGYVSQTPFLITGSIRENIAYGLQDVSDSEIEDAARMANIYDEILNMQGEFSANVGERGRLLSGGQRQRISLARTFLRNPQILILDEATSALDNINERIIQSAISDHWKGKTIVSVAHRLTTLKDADRIVVFAGGEIVEDGTYENLLSEEGIFSQMHNAANI